MKKRVLITGSICLLGDALIKTAPLDFELFLGFHKNRPKKNNLNYVFFDLQDENVIKKTLLKIKPEIIIHTAAISDPDFSQKNKKLTWEVNVEGTKKITKNLKKSSPVKVVFLSSNAIFNGLKPPYSELSKPIPANFYGETKLEGEHIIKKSGLPFLIFRMMTMFGWNPIGSRDNPVTWKIKKLEKKQALYLVTDKFLNPLYNMQAAESVWRALKKSSRGVYHIAGNDTISRYTFGLKVADIFGFDKKLIIPVSSDYFPNLASRANNSTLETKKMMKILNMTPLKITSALKKMRDLK